MKSTYITISAITNVRLYGVGFTPRNSEHQPFSQRLPLLEFSKSRKPLFANTVPPEICRLSKQVLLRWIPYNKYKILNIIKVGSLTLNEILRFFNVIFYRDFCYGLRKSWEHSTSKSWEAEKQIWDALEKIARCVGHVGCIEPKTNDLH